MSLLSLLLLLADATSTDDDVDSLVCRGRDGAPCNEEVCTPPPPYTTPTTPALCILTSFSNISVPRVSLEEEANRLLDVALDCEAEDIEAGPRNS